MFNQKTWYKKCLGLFKEWLTTLVNVPSHTKCVSLCNQKREIQRTLVNLHPNESSQGLYYYPFAIKLDRCAGIFDTCNDLLIVYVF